MVEFSNFEVASVKAEKRMSTLMKEYRNLDQTLAEQVSENVGLVACNRQYHLELEDMTQARNCLRVQQENDLTLRIAERENEQKECTRLRSVVDQLNDQLVQQTTDHGIVVAAAKDECMAVQRELVHVNEQHSIAMLVYEKKENLYIREREEQNTAMEHLRNVTQVQDQQDRQEKIEQQEKQEKETREQQNTEQQEQQTQIGKNKVSNLNTFDHTVRPVYTHYW